MSSFDSLSAGRIIYFWLDCYLYVDQRSFLACSPEIQLFLHSGAALRYHLQFLPLFGPSQHRPNTAFSASQTLLQAHPSVLGAHRPSGPLLTSRSEDLPGFNHSS